MKNTEKKFISENEKALLEQLNNESNSLSNLTLQIGQVVVDIELMKGQAAKTKVDLEGKFTDFRKDLFDKYGNVQITNEGEIVSTENQDSE